MDEKKKKPALRFAGFDDDWEQRKLGEVSNSFEYGLNVAAKEFDGENKYIRITDINDDSHEFVADDITSPDIDLSNADGYKLVEGDILFARTGASVGKTYIYKESDGQVYYAGFLIRAQIKQEYNPEFIFQNTLTIDYKKYIAITSQRSGQPGVNAQEYSEYKIIMPNRVEQDKISSYFRNLDHLITLHQRKLDKMKNFKKAMLEKMFPKEDEKIPEVRFAGFTDDWEQRKLGDTMETITDYVAAGSFADLATNVVYKLDQDYAQLVRTVDLKHNFKNGSFIYVDKKAFDFLWRVNLDSECIVLPNIGANIGEVYYLAPSELPYRNNVLGPNAIYLKPKEDSKFVYSLFETEDFQCKLALIVASSGQPKFNKTELKQISILLPSNDEQNKIGDYFRSLDHLITLHQRQLEKLKNIKKSMLEKMFV